jgi:hypothetical protein
MKFKRDNSAAGASAVSPCPIVGRRYTLHPRSLQLGKGSLCGRGKGGAFPPSQLELDWPE